MNHSAGLNEVIMEKGGYEVCTPSMPGVFKKKRGAEGRVGSTEAETGEATPSQEM